MGIPEVRQNTVNLVVVLGVIVIAAGVWVGPEFRANTANVPPVLNELNNDLQAAQAFLNDSAQLSGRYDNIIANNNLNPKDLISPNADKTVGALCLQIRVFDSSAVPQADIQVTILNNSNFSFVSGVTDGSGDFTVTNLSSDGGTNHTASAFVEGTNLNGDTDKDLDDGDTASPGTANNVAVTGIANQNIPNTSGKACDIAGIALASFG